MLAMQSLQMAEMSLCYTQQYLCTVHHNFGTSEVNWSRLKSICCCQVDL